MTRGLGSTHCMDPSLLLQAIVSPPRVWSRSEVLFSRPCPIPPEAGVYGWFFRQAPAAMDLQRCHKFQGLRLLYVGISPRPPTADRAPSRQNLRKRIRSHFAGRADGSTLRLTLGRLLADQLGIRLGLSPSGRFTFHEGEEVLSDWMAENAFVAWLATPSPWAIEEMAIRELDLPLNLDQNRSHVFYPTLSAVRRAAKVQARMRS